MVAISFALLALLGSGAVALEALEARHVYARDGGQAFTPAMSFKDGDTCSDAFGDGYQTCSSSLCYSPNDGEICCDKDWPCPPGSFCLADGKCCPNGLDEKTCAQQISASLSSVYASASASSAYSSSEPSATYTTDEDNDVYTTYSDSTTTSIYKISTAYPSASATYPTTAKAEATTYPSAGHSTSTLTVKAGATSSQAVSPAAFTGAASVQNAGGMVAVLVGALAVARNML